MKAGFLLPTRNVVTGRASPSSAMRSMVASASRLDALGYDSLWVGDSLLGRPRPEPLTVLAAIAMVTTNIKLGTAAILPAMRHPLHLAQQAATLDLISGGRLILGAGIGFPNEQTKLELEALEIPFETRARRCHEAVAWCKSLWGGEAPSKPDFWTLDPDLRIDPKTAQPRGPRFWLGGATDVTCRRVARHYDGWMPTSPSPETFKHGWQILCDEAGKVGRDVEDITACSVLTLSLDNDPNTAQDKLRYFIETYYGAPLEAARQVVGCAAGSVDGVIEQIKAFEDAGVEHLILRFAADDQSVEIEKWAEPLINAMRT